jgi:glycolate oxidase FAD binding subunit
VKPSGITELLRELSQPNLEALGVVLSAGSGLGYAWASAADLPSYKAEDLRRFCHQLGGYLTVLKQPAETALPAWLDAPARPMALAIKRQFDPKQQLARGRLPGVQPTPAL